MEKTFTYAVPAALREEVQRGCRVLVPLSQAEEADCRCECPQEEESKLKEIDACLDLGAVLPWE